MKPEKALQQIDIAVICLNGQYGENGEIQKLLKRFGIPHTGPDAFGSFIALHKVMAKTHAKEVGLLTPDFRYIERAEDAQSAVREVIRTFLQPVVVKPVQGSGKSGILTLSGYAPVYEAVEACFKDGAQGVLIEEHIRGKDASVGIVEDLRGEPLYALPPLMKAGLSRVEVEEIVRGAKLMHEALAQRHYSQTNFIVSPRGVYFIETVRAPGVDLGNESEFSKSLAAVGVTLPEFVSHLVGLALAR